MHKTITVVIETGGNCLLPVILYFFAVLHNL